MFSKRGLILCVMMLALVGLLAIPNFAAAAEPCQGNQQAAVDGFELLVDLSGSRQIDFEYETELMKMIGEALPPFDYTAALRNFYKEKFADGPGSNLVYGPTIFDRVAFSQALSELGFWQAAQTPLGEAINASAGELGPIGSNQALVIFSDFEWSQQFGHPAEAATALREKFGDSLRIHTVLLGGEGGGEELATSVAAIGGGNRYSAEELRNNPAYFQRFMSEVFGGGEADSDCDGVVDGIDDCPGTPSELLVDAVGCRIPLSISLNIEFDVDQAVIRDEFKPEIARATDFLNAHPENTAMIQGNTDSDGSDLYNQNLSRMRAESVRQYLVEEMGIDAARLTAVGYGEIKPVASNSTAAGKQENRRVDVVFSDAWELR